MPSSLDRCFPVSPGHLAPNTMDPWQNSQNTTPEHYVTSALLTRKLKGLAVQALKYHHPWFLSCVSNTFPAIETNKQNFSGNQKEKETFLYLCTDLGKKPPTLFSGHCFNNWQGHAIRIRHNIYSCCPPSLFFAIHFMPDSATQEKKKCFHHILSNCKNRNGLHYCPSQKTSSPSLDSH